MKTKSLSNTNPHLQDRKLSRKRIIRSVATSTAIETGESIEQIERKLKKHSSRYQVGLA